MGEEEYESDDDEEDDDTESSVDLLIRFVRSIFKKVSKRARKATSSILPDIISPQLVICTLGGTVFVVILLLRVLWSAVDYFQSSSTGFNQSGASYGNSQPVT
nr:protein SHORT HYPOCOTYL IN WHITE LIGHT 1 isoform X1 [Ipomoea batatas]GMD19585.1 protein SHORT HYPOCOTYL IN WHITE LIGHT 1 isoform X1 [Ipomoea batatas]